MLVSVLSASTQDHLSLFDGLRPSNWINTSSKAMDADEVASILLNNDVGTTQLFTGRSCRPVNSVRALEANSVTESETEKIIITEIRP